MKSMEKLVYPLAIAGSLLLATQLLSQANSFWRHFLRPGCWLPDRYGPQSWVLITGASTGIGYAFAKAFAQLKFNLILIDKNPNVTEAANELRLRYQVETMPIVVDLTQVSMDSLAEKWSELDVSVLINNAGIHCFEYFVGTSQGTIESVINLNIRALTRLTHALMPKLTSRSHKSAIINMSSIAGLVPTPLSAVYSASKAYIRAFSLALAAESNLDVLAVEPSTVKTDMTSWVPRGYFLIEPDLLVKRALRMLGYEQETIGAKRHIALYLQMQWLSLEVQAATRNLQMQPFLPH
jgi:short-subunit dehydrogenase